MALCNIERYGALYEEESNAVYNDYFICSYCYWM